MKKLFYNGVVVTGVANEIIDDGYIVVNDEIIETIGKGSPPLFLEVDEKVNLHGNWVIPGLINTHGHIGMTLLRGFGDDLPLDAWLKTKMWPMEAKFTQETIEAATSLAIVEMLKSGTTTFLEMYHMHLGVVARLVDLSGIRAVLTRGMIGLCSVSEQENKLSEAIELAKTLKKVGQGRISTMLAPHAPYTCPPAFLEMVAKEAKKEKLGIHIHLSETANEVNEHIEKYKKRPAEHLAELGVFDVHTLIAHGVHLSNMELDLLANHNVAVSHNPISNLKLGSGIANVPTMIKKNIVVAIGTDSAASNNNLDMFQEMRMAALLHKGHQQDPTQITASEAFMMATYNGGKALALDKIGCLQEGYLADFIIIDHQKPHLQPENHVLSHLVYSASGEDVKSVYINGRCVVNNKICLFLDEEKIIFEANRSFKKILA